MPTAVMRLLVDPDSGITQHSADRSYLVGMDQMPWPCRSRYAPGELVIERGVSDSGRYLIPFPVAGHGELMLSTATLMQRDRPYRLEIELARGKLNQVRNQLADWQAMGLVVSDEVRTALNSALGEFSGAVTSPEDPPLAADRARRAIVSAVAAGEALADCYTEQALALRRRQTPKLPTRLGANLGRKPVMPVAGTHLLSAFNAFSLPLLWRDVEATEGNHQWDIFDRHVDWCNENNVAVFGGPLLRMDDRGLPDWLTLWEDDFEALLSFTSDYVAACVGRYRDRVSLWQCAARVNVADALGLQDDQKMQLIVRALEVTQSMDPGVPTIIRFDQPWGEYLRRADDTSPLHFADSLVRSGLKLGGLGLEFNVGYYPNGTTIRDRLDFSRMLDLWSCLGLPLHITLVVPSSDEPDPKARSCSTPVPCVGGWNPEVQATWVKRFVPLMLAKSYVHSITWNWLSDAEPHEFAHGGLFDAGGAAKPAFTALAGIRKKYLA